MAPASAVERVCAAAVERPRLDEHPRTGDAGYRLVYRVRGAAGTCLLQRVRVHIRYRIGAHVVADYRGVYHECFVFTADGDATDVHDFDVFRDGWRQALLEPLLHRGGTRSTAGAPSLVVRKSFVLGAGEVHDAQATAVGHGVRFGFLANGPAGPSRAWLTAATGTGTRRHAAAALPFAMREPLCGTGVFTAARAWRATEHFHYSFACLAGSLRDRGGYVPATPAIAPPRGTP